MCVKNFGKHNWYIHFFNAKFIITVENAHPHHAHLHTLTSSENTYLLQLLWSMSQLRLIRGLVTHTACTHLFLPVAH